MLGGLGGNKEVEAAAIESRSESSKWVERLGVGKLGRNKALKLAYAREASALLCSVLSVSSSTHDCPRSWVSALLTRPRLAAITQGFTLDSSAQRPWPRTSWQALEIEPGRRIPKQTAASIILDSNFEEMSLF